jgi:peroxiredoxin family protein
MIMAERTTIILHSGEMDKVFSALIIGNGALSMGMEATIYFTFWGLQRLKKGGLRKGKLSKMNMLGLGKSMVEGRMAKAGVASLDQMMKDYKELGGRIIACEMTMEVTGIKKEDLETGLIDEFGAVGTYVNVAKDSKITLFI